MQIQFLPAFLIAISIVFSVFKIPWYESWLTQQPTPPQLSIHFIGFQFSNELISNCLPSSIVHSSILVILTTLLHSIASASLCLTPSPRPTSYPRCSCLSWFSACWPFYWNSLLPNLGSIGSYAAFKSYLNTYVFSSASISENSGAKNYLR